MFSQMRTIAVLAELAAEPGNPIVFDSAESAAANDEEGRFASWAWRIGAISFAHLENPYEFEQTALLHWLSTLRFPEYQLGDAAMAAAWVRIDAWVLDLGEAVDIYRDTDLVTFAAQLETLTVDLEEKTALLCTLLATVGQRAEEDPGDRGSVLARLALEELLLATEYLGVVRSLLGSPEVQWLTGDATNLTVADDGVTSHAEALRAWQHAIDFSLYLHALYRDQAVVSVPPPAIPQAGGRS
jgi:hypothetical protein